MENSPSPFLSGFLVSKYTQWRCCNWSSLASSRTKILSESGIKPLMAFKTDVFPDDVPPDTIVFFLSFTIAFSRSAPSCGMLEKDSSFSRVSMSRLNLRMDIIVPQRLMGGIVTCTREPSGSLASKSGWRASRILSTDLAMFEAAAISWDSLENFAWVSSNFPDRSTYICSAPFMRISDTLSSPRKPPTGAKKSARKSLFEFIGRYFFICGFAPIGKSS